MSGERVAHTLGRPLRSLLRVPDRLLLLAIPIHLRAEFAGRAETILDTSLLRQAAETGSVWAAVKLVRLKIGFV